MRADCVEEERATNNHYINDTNHMNIFFSIYAQQNPSEYLIVYHIAIYSISNFYFCTRACAIFIPYILNFYSMLAEYASMAIVK